MSFGEFKDIKLPDGYEIATIAKYPKTRREASTGRIYRFAVQLLNKATFDIPRGTGMTAKSALKRAVANAGGDDGLSKSIREMAMGTRH